MVDKYNPFRPDKMATIGLFAGRLAELRIIDHCLTQTKSGNPQHFLIQGERGIGKSSLFLCEFFVASGRINTLSGARLNFIVMSISLQEKDDHYTIIKKIASALKQQLLERNSFKALTLSAMDFISRIEAGGFRLNKAETTIDDTELLAKLQIDLVKILTDIEGKADGILLLIDEADKAPPSAGLGLICKLLTEELSRRQCERLCIGLAGLPNVVQVLKESHESSPRIFKTMVLKPLEADESGMVIDRGIKEAVDKNGFEISVTAEARALICSLSEGYPHFLQEYSYCAFEEDIDNVIDKTDVSNCLYRENGAFDQLGIKYFSQYYSAPASNDYRKVLDILAEHGSDEWVDRATIIAESELKPGIVDNALRALKTKNIISRNEMAIGKYRLPTRSFAVWIRARNAALRSASEADGTKELFDL